MSSPIMLIILLSLWSDSGFITASSQFSQNQCKLSYSLDHAIKWRGSQPDEMKVAEIFFVIFHLIANFVDLKNIYFAKSSLSYKANLRLQMRLTSTTYNLQPKYSNLFKTTI